MHKSPNNSKRLLLFKEYFEKKRHLFDRSLPTKIRIFGRNNENPDI